MKTSLLFKIHSRHYLRATSEHPNKRPIIQNPIPRHQPTHSARNNSQSQQHANRAGRRQIRTEIKSKQAPSRENARKLARAQEIRARAGVHGSFLDLKSRAPSFPSPVQASRARIRRHQKGGKKYTGKGLWYTEYDAQTPRTHIKDGGEHPLMS